MSAETISAALVRLPTTEGTFEAVLTDLGLCCLRFPNEAGDTLAWLGRRLAGARVRDRDSRSGAIAEELDAYLRGELRSFAAPLDLHGTDFQLAVWNQLLGIPYGEVRSYADVALAIGRPSAVRAVGAANGANPVPVVVPCHRVIGSGGGLVGFGAGLPWKRRLLAIENPGRWATRIEPDGQASLPLVPTLPRRGEREGQGEEGGAGGLVRRRGRS